MQWVGLMAICCRTTMFTMSVREMKTLTIKINTLKMVKVESITDW
jgi:hypothetical protein